MQWEMKCWVRINRTVRAFVTHDRELARQVIEDDAEINEYEVKLERKSFEIIALQQPVSQDLVSWWPS